MLGSTSVHTDLTSPQLGGRGIDDVYRDTKRKQLRRTRRKILRRTPPPQGGGDETATVRWSPEGEEPEGSEFRLGVRDGQAPDQHASQQHWNPDKRRSDVFPSQERGGDETKVTLMSPEEGKSPRGDEHNRHSQPSTLRYKNTL